MTRSVAPGLYVHVPFCARVCPYCDFAVQTGGAEKRDGYVRSLLREIECWSPRWRSAQPFDTIYLGGGTPSALSLEALEAMLAAVRKALPVSDAAAITLEANPEDVSDALLAGWKRLGVSRLSLGVQAFDDGALSLLGRAHTAEEAQRAVERSLAAGLEAVSLDLIFAVPGQTPARWERTLRSAVELQPHHISCYELTVHDDTHFGRARLRGAFVEMPEDDKAEQFFFTHRFLADAGYPAYEVSNFARDRQSRSRHNAKYWQHAPYLGLGPSAHSFDGRRRRWWNERRLVDWQQALDARGDATCEQEVLTPGQLVLEALALGLRTTAGVDLEAIRERFGIDLRGGNSATIDSLAARGLLEVAAGSVLVPTLAGLAVADAIAAAFEITAGVSERPGGA